MKVIMNTLTNYQDKILQQGEIVDIELKVAERWINMGIAHLLEVSQKKDLPEEVIFREPKIKSETKDPVKKSIRKLTRKSVQKKNK